MKWQARFSIKERSENWLGLGVAVKGEIEFLSSSKVFPSQGIPAPIEDVGVFADFEPGEVFTGEFRDDFGAWPAFEGQSATGENLAFSLRTQADKVYSEKRGHFA